MDNAPQAFAVTSGEEHSVVYANTAFRREFGLADHADGILPIAVVLPQAVRADIVDLLDRAFAADAPVDEIFLTSASRPADHVACAAWAVEGVDHASRRMVIQLRSLGAVETARIRQRDIAERMMLSALRDQDLATKADIAQQLAAFLSDVSRGLAVSLDEATTLRTMIGFALPRLAEWCVADTVESNGDAHRIIVSGPDENMKKLARALEVCWKPAADDPFGPSHLSAGAAPVRSDGGAESLAGRSTLDDAKCRELFELLGVGPKLTVTLAAQGRVIGAATFIRAVNAEGFTDADIQLAGDIAERSAVALFSARLFGDAQRFRTEAEAANKAKTQFLHAMSHELRTPLNAIGGYVDLIDMGIRGDVTPEQRVDLARIRSNQKHLLTLISQVLDLAKIDSGHLQYQSHDVIMQQVISHVVSMVQPLATKQSLTLTAGACSDGAIATGDSDKIVQILVNLIGNAIKFTLPGGSIDIECVVSGNVVVVRILDTGRGIDAVRLDGIFEPFAQVHLSLTGPDAGIGLGLSIILQLARGMGGDISVISTPGEGSCFTLTLPLSSTVLEARPA